MLTNVSNFRHLESCTCATIPCEMQKIEFQKCSVLNKKCTVCVHVGFVLVGGLLKCVNTDMAIAYNSQNRPVNGCKISR